VQRFDATTGVNTGNFAPSLTNPSPRDVKVNPANNRLYVLYYNAATVETFDLATMASYGLLMPAGSPIGSGGLYTPSAMALGPDGNLYTTNQIGPPSNVLRFDGTTGAFLDDFVTAESGGLLTAWVLAFGPDGDLYLASLDFYQPGVGAILRYDGTTGTFIDVFTSGGPQPTRHSTPGFPVSGKSISNMPELPWVFLEAALVRVRSSRSRLPVSLAPRPRPAAASTALRSVARLSRWNLDTLPATAPILP
jgi:DNA-binding beta-propeller fold protein YncE